MFKGTINTEGRKKGTPNKVTSEVKEAFSKLLENNIEKLQADIDKLEPKQRLDVILQIAKFIIPTMKAVEYEATIETNTNTFTPVQIQLISKDEHSKL
jgi:hypothetical protein